MHKLAFSGLFATSALSAAALFAAGSPVRVMTAPSTAPVLKVSKAASPAVRVLPLDAGALGAASAQVRAAFPKAATAPATGPLTLDAAHWTASAGALSGWLEIQGPMAIGGDPQAPPGWMMASDSVVIVSVSGLQSGALYLLDCSIAANDGTSVTLNMCPGNNAMACMVPGTGTTASLGVAGNHALYGFSASQGSAVFALGNAANTTMSGCTLHPVN